MSGRCGLADRESPHAPCRGEATHVAIRRPNANGEVVRIPICRGHVGRIQSHGDLFTVRKLDTDRIRKAAALREARERMEALGFGQADVREELERIARHWPATAGRS